MRKPLSALAALCCAAFASLPAHAQDAGTLLAGVFATRVITASADDPGVSGLLEGDAHQFVVQAIGVGVTVAWCAVGTYVVLRFVDALIPLRAEPDEEREGLDIALHGEALHQ